MKADRAGIYFHHRHVMNVVQRNPEPRTVVGVATRRMWLLSYVGYIPC